MTYNASFTVNTQGFTDITDITSRVADAVEGSGMGDGVAVIFTPGSTAGLTTIEYEPGAVADLKSAIERIAPADIHYNHDARWGDGNGFAHVRAALLGPSLCVPFQDGRLALGTWQQVILVDFDNRERQRKVTVHVTG